MSPPKPPLTVAIIGGGLGGLFTALSLHHHCASNLNISVYEQAPQYKEIGAGVGIGVNAAKLFERLGLLDDAFKIAGSRKHIWLSFRRYDDGREILTVPAKEEGRLKQLSVQRAELLDLLVNAVRERGAAKLETDKCCLGLKVSNLRLGQEAVGRINKASGRRGEDGGRVPRWFECDCGSRDRGGWHSLQRQIKVYCTSGISSTITPRFSP